MSMQRVLLLYGVMMMAFMLGACTVVDGTDAAYSLNRQTENPAAPTVQKQVLVGRIDSAIYDSVDTLFSKADYVIKGKIIDSRVEWMSHVIQPTPEEASNPKLNPGGEKDDTKDLTTIYTVEVSDTFRGEARKTIEVMQLGGETETAIYRYEESPAITKYQTYVMFLRKSHLHENGSWLLNQAQAVYQVDGDVLVKPTEFAFDFALNDLSRLAGRK
jgi:hypothetical protein